MNYSPEPDDGFSDLLRLVHAGQGHLRVLAVVGLGHHGPQLVAGHEGGQCPQDGPRHHGGRPVPLPPTPARLQSEVANKFYSLVMRVLVNKIHSKNIIN